MKKLIIIATLIGGLWACSKPSVDNSIYADVYCERIAYLQSNTQDSVFYINNHQRIYFNTEGIDTLEIVTWSKFDFQIDVYKGEVLLERRFPELYFNDTIRIVLK